MAVFGAPSYFARRPRPQDAAGPHRPRLHQPPPADLWRLYAWAFAKDGRALKVRAEGQLVFNSVALNSTRPWPGSAWRTCPRIWCRRTSPMDGSSGCSPTGARPFQATTSTTRAAGNPHRPSPSWSRRYATGADSNILGWRLTAASGAVSSPPSTTLSTRFQSVPPTVHLAPFDDIYWPQISYWVRFVRAKGHCQVCGRPHGERVQLLVV